MGKIDELIKQLCPDGVQLVSLDSVCSFKRGTTITAKKAIPGEIPVIAGGQTPSYYHNDANRDGETIAVAGSGAYAGFVSYWNVPIFLSDAFSVEPCSKVMHKYLFYYLRHNQQKIYALQKGAGVPHVHGSDISKFKIPLPPLAVQKEIVGILNTFAGMIDNLQKELEQRQKQFEYYQEKILKFEDGIETVSFGESFHLKARIGWQGLTKKEYRTEGAYKLVTGTDFTNNHRIDFEKCVYVDKDRYDQDENIQLKEDDVLITKDGTLGKIAYIDKLKYPATLNGGVFVVRDKTGRIKQKFTQHYLSSSIFKKWIESNHTSGSIQHLTQKLLVKFRIPVPSLEKQQEIVDKLDTFEALISNIKQEIALRQKQYEYYREKLLAFE